MRRLLAALLCLSAAAPANSAALFFADTPQSFYACVSTAPSSTVDLYVIAGPAGGDMSAARFRIPAPACPGLSIIGATVMSGFIATGDVETGIEIASAACLTGTVAVLKLECFVTTTECCELSILPHPSAVTGQPEIIDCALQARVCETAHAFVTTGTTGCNYTLPPSVVYPVDGMTGVPTSLTLQWAIEPPHLCSPIPFGDLWSDVYLGTDPDPPLYASGFQDPFAFESAFAYNPGPLAPATLYYWKVGVMNFGVWGNGAVWSFTTEGTTPTESRTWGAVKALYR